jgi:hypothetical protein
LKTLKNGYFPPSIGVSYVIYQKHLKISISEKYSITRRHTK